MVGGGEGPSGPASFFLSSEVRASSFRDGGETLQLLRRRKVKMRASFLPEVYLTDDQRGRPRLRSRVLCLSVCLSIYSYLYLHCAQL